MKKLLLVICVLISANLAWAGASSSSGGGAFYDDSANRSLFLDLWENDIINFPREFFPSRGLDIPYSDEPVEAQLESALLKLRDVDLGLYRVTLDNLRLVRDPSHQWVVPDHIKIPAPADARNDYAPDGYVLSGMFLFSDRDQVLSIDQEIYDVLANNTHKAAAWLHEALYKSMRDWGAELPSSAPARRLTACLFSRDLLSESCLAYPLRVVPSSFDFRCVGSGATVYVDWSRDRLRKSKLIVTTIDYEPTWLWRESDQLTWSNLSDYGVKQGRIDVNGEGAVDDELSSLQLSYSGYFPSGEFNQVQWNLMCHRLLH